MTASSPQTAQPEPQLVTSLFYPTGSEKRRVFALGYFVSLMVIWNLLGHTVLGFEQSWAQMFVAVGTALAAQIGFDWIDSKLRNRPFRLKSDPVALLAFFAPALISGFAIGMILFPNRLLEPLAFASILAIGSKIVLRAPIGDGKTQHFMNPSNFGIVVTLFACPWVSIAPPYHFLGHAQGYWNWLAPTIILISGIIVHAMATGRLVLVCSWLLGFLAQAFIRHWILGASIVAALMPMTGAAFVIFTLYMVPDPAVTPLRLRSQVIFGASVALLYGCIQAGHQVYGLFGALFLISLIRGIILTCAHSGRNIRAI